MMAQGDDDARAYPRARARIKVEYHFGETLGVDHTGDISQGGIFLYTHRTAQAGTRVYLRLHLPGSRAGEPLKVIGVVRHAHDPVVVPGSEAQPGMGIEFVEAYAHTREQLAEFVAALLTDPTGDPPPIIRELGRGPESTFGARLTGGDRALLDAAEVERTFRFGSRRRAEPKQRLFQLLIVLVILSFVLAVVVHLASK
jgi:uncharacterized protein (TIGR02266 family)